MALTEKQQASLDAMGITRWVPQGSEESSAEQAVVAQTSAAPAPIESPVNAEPSTDWTALEQAVRQCKRCELHKTRTQTVFGVGSHQADILIIGEAPGADEDRQGEPFVGRAGQLLNEMLRAIGLARQSVYIANILKCRPPNNRDPKPEEAAQCAEYLYQQIHLLQPKLVLALGRIAAQRLLKTDAALARLRGKLHYLPQTQTPFIVTYHPAYLLRSPLEKRKAWDDLLFACKTIQSN